MSKNTTQLVIDLKNEGQDFEWYPTTERMLRVVATNMMGHFYKGVSIMDIGAGDGRALETIGRIYATENAGARVITQMLAIERSPILIQKMSPDICIVGTDFDCQTLIDKDVDCIFCNPPYSIFEQWMSRIIREANCKSIYFVVPERWIKSEAVADAIKKRKATASILSTDNFRDADRQARAVVHIVRVSLSTYGDCQAKLDAFDAWFDETFKIKAVKENERDYDRNQADKARISASIVKGKNIIESIEELYRADMDVMLRNYQAVGILDADILKELNVSVDGLKTAMRQKIKGMKALYWEELFSNLETLTSRLTKSTRDTMLENFKKHLSVDFTVDNAYALVVWAIKNVNRYVDQQLVEVYEEMTCEKNARNYKSNRHMTADTWRFCRHHDRDERKAYLHHYTLDYRIVLDKYRAIFVNGSFSYAHEAHRGLYKTAHDSINDIFVVANNLGFKANDTTMDRDWVGGETQDFFYKKDGADVILFSVRAFQNGNIHIKCNQDFMRAFNIEAARLNHWVKTADEAADEMGIPASIAKTYFDHNLQIPLNPGLLLNA